KQGCFGRSASKNPRVAASGERTPASSLDDDGCSVNFAPSLQLHLDAGGLAELAVDLEGLLGAVDRVAVDLSDHVPVLEAELLVERSGADRENLESVRLPVLEGGDDASLGRQRAQVRELALDVLARDLVGFLVDLPDVGRGDLGTAAPRGGRGGARLRRLGGLGALD